MPSSRPEVGEYVRCVDAEGACDRLAEGELYEVLAIDHGLPPLITVDSGAWALRRFQRLPERVPVQPVAAPRRCTLAIEQHDENVYLMLEDGRGGIEPLACFVSPEAPARFTEAFALAKVHAHAMGQLGI